MKLCKEYSIILIALSMTLRLRKQYFSASLWQKQNSEPGWFDLKVIY